MSFIRQSSPISIFPIYLLPSIPFRRRKPSADSAGTTSSTESSNFTDKTITSSDYLNGHISYLRCAQCATDLCLTAQIISKGFTGRHGRAYLVSGSPTSRTSSATYLPNTQTGQPVKRQLVTGQHTVSDLSCAFCGLVIGWKYDAAEEETQRYKIGKFILETKRILSSSRWQNQEAGGDCAMGLRLEVLDKHPEAGVEFDSQDEDECEDLFAGVWSRSLALKRRRARRFGRPDSRSSAWRR